MNKSDLIKAFSKETELTRAKATEVDNLMFDKMNDALASGDRVQIRGFCSIYVKEHKGYTGRNFKTGALRQLPPNKLPFFKSGKELKERVDYK